MSKETRQLTSEIEDESAETASPNWGLALSIRNARNKRLRAGGSYLSMDDSGGGGGDDSDGGDGGDGGDDGGDDGDDGDSGDGGDSGGDGDGN